MLLVQGRISQKYGFQMCLLVVLGSQCIVVKCTAAIFFLTVESHPRFRAAILFDFSLVFLCFSLDGLKERGTARSLYFGALTKSYRPTGHQYSGHFITILCYLRAPLHTLYIEVIQRKIV